jgi:hypothetical protein
MRIKVQVVIERDEETQASVHEVAHLERGALRAETLGLGLEEAKDLLAQVQDVMVAEQVRACLAQHLGCADCGRARRHKDARTITVQTLFGALRLQSPRWHHCACRPHATKTFSPLAEVMPERTSPELLYLEAKFAGLVSYGLSTRLLGELLPLGQHLHAMTLRRHVQATAERLEDELGPEQVMFIEGCPGDWEDLPRPDLPLTVGLDGGYVHASTQRSRREGWFEVIAGKRRAQRRAGRRLPTLVPGVRVRAQGSAGGMTSHGLSGLLHLQHHPQKFSPQSPWRVADRAALNFKRRRGRPLSAARKPPRGPQVPSSGAKISCPGGASKAVTTSR